MNKNTLLCDTVGCDSPAEMTVEWSGRAFCSACATAYEAGLDDMASWHSISIPKDIDPRNETPYYDYSLEE